ncbi:MAG: Mut7-C RNAse domain-containing protein [Methanocellales archaeon]
MSNIKFIADRMLGRLTAWLRLLGYDTLSASDLRKGEDDLLLEIAKKEGRIIVSRDRELVRKAKARGIAAILIHSEDVLKQLKEMHSHINLNLEAKMDRCTICNHPIRIVKSEEMEVVKAKEYVFPDLFERNIEFWICDNCKRVYWEGSHWNNIQKTVAELKKEVEI